MHTHRRHIDEEKYTGVFSFVEWHIFNHFCVKNTSKMCTFQIFWGKKIHVLKNILVYVSKILFNNDAQQIYSILFKKGQENCAETGLLTKKMDNGEKCILKFCFSYIDNRSTRQKMHFMYINRFILEACHILHSNLDHSSTHIFF